MLLPIHIAASGLASVLGAVALLVKKGGTNHRRGGLLATEVTARALVEQTANPTKNFFRWTSPDAIQLAIKSRAPAKQR